MSVSVNAFLGTKVEILKVLESYLEWKPSQIGENVKIMYTDTDEPAGAPKIPSKNIPTPCMRTSC